MMKNKINSIVSYIIIVLIVFIFSFVVFGKLKDFESSVVFLNDEPALNRSLFRKTTPPNYVRGIYLTAYSASRDDWRGRLAERMKAGEMNTVVIDIKDYTGYILYNSELDILKKYDTIKPIISDVEEVLKDFHDAGIYVIARLTVFQDPILAKVRPDLAVKTTSGGTWYNYGGLAWMDPAKQEVWDYNIAIAEEAARLGFDEINFDYIRYPSDGNLKSMELDLKEGETKPAKLEEFFAYLSGKLSNKVNISADMFGLVMDNTKTGYDLGIGQVLTTAIPYFDFICPMMYPSHYNNGYMGFSNPAEYPGAVVANGIKLASDSFVGGRSTLRPWLQAFSIGAVYDEAKIKEQTNAVEKTESTGWLLWNARNYYEDYLFWKNSFATKNPE